MENQVKTLDDVAADRWRISIWLTAIMMVIYFGFILLIAYNKPLLATPVVSGLSLGILLGALTIVTVWVLTYIYVHWANTTYDLHVAELQAGLRNTGNGSNPNPDLATHLTTDASGSTDASMEDVFTENKGINGTEHEREDDA
jgi:uncharacterized membrane protein (DUF485 family)